MRKPFLTFKVHFKGSFFINDKAFMITGESLGYLTAFFNSKLFRFCFKDYFPELLGDTRELRKVFFETIPVKTAFDEDWFLEKITEIQNRKLKSISTADIESEIETKLSDHYKLSERDRKMIGES